MTITVDVSKGGDYALADYELQAGVVAAFYHVSCQALALTVLRFNLVDGGFTEAGADKVIANLPEADRRRARDIVERTVDPASYVEMMRGGTWE